MLRLAWKKVNMQFLNCLWCYMSRNCRWNLGKENGTWLTASKKIETSVSTVKESQTFKILCPSPFNTHGLLWYVDAKYSKSGLTSYRTHFFFCCLHVCLEEIRTDDISRIVMVMSLGTHFIYIYIVHYHSNMK